MLEVSPVIVARLICFACARQRTWERRDYHGTPQGLTTEEALRDPPGAHIMPAVMTAKHLALHFSGHNPGISTKNDFTTPDDKRSAPHAVLGAVGGRRSFASPQSLNHPRTVTGDICYGQCRVLPFAKCFGWIPDPQLPQPRPFQGQDAAFHGEREAIPSWLKHRPVPSFKNVNNVQSCGTPQEMPLEIGELWHRCTS